MANIVKGRFDQPFVMLYNEAVQDKNLSMQAKGLHAYLLSLPGDWEIHVRELPNNFKNGRDAVANALNELIDETYVIRNEQRKKGKFNGMAYEVYPVKYQRAVEMGLITPGGIETPKENQIKPKKEDGKEEIPFKEIIEYLNKATGKSFKHTTKATQKAISGRWKEGHDFEAFKHVIDVKTAEWKGTEFENYLCPDTLFRPSNFEKYLNQKPKKSKQPEFKRTEQPKKPRVGVVMSEEERQRMLEEAGIQA